MHARDEELRLGHSLVDERVETRLGTTVRKHIHSLRHPAHRIIDAQVRSKLGRHGLRTPRLAVHFAPQLRVLQQNCSDSAQCLHVGAAPSRL